MASFSHPSYPATKMHWGRLTTVPYLWETVVPQLQEARSFLLSAGGEAESPTGRVDEPAACDLPVGEADERTRREAAVDERPQPAPHQDSSMDAQADEEQGHDIPRFARTRTFFAASVHASRGMVDATRSRVGDWLARRRTDEAKRGRPLPKPGPGRPPVKQMVETCPACEQPIGFDGRCGCS